MAAKAEPLRKDYLQWCRDIFGEHHLETVLCFNVLGNDLNAQGRYAEAQVLYQKALDRSREVLGEKHPITAGIYGNLGLNRIRQAKYAEAQLLGQKSLDIRLEVLGENHPDVATSYDRICLNLKKQGKYSESQEFYQKALDLRVHILGPRHADTATSYSNLACNLDAQNKRTEAELLHRKSLAIRREILGDTHPDTAAAFNNLACNLDAQNKRVEAELLHRKSLAIRRDVLGNKHPYTATSYNNLASNLDAQGKYAEAEPLFMESLTIRRATLGERHPKTAISYNSTACNLFKQGKYAEALPLFEKALDSLRLILGDKHPRTITSYRHLAIDLGMQGKYAEAQPIFEQILKLRLELFGNKHPNTAQSCNDVATNLTNLHKYAQAQTLYQRALDVNRELLGEKHPHTATNYSQLATNLAKQGKFAEAQPLFEKALHIRLEVLGEKHPDTATNYHNIAVNLSNQNNFAQAKPLFDKALAHYLALFGKNHQTTARCYLDVARNLIAQHHYEDAHQLLVRAAASYEAARLRITRTGVDRAVFGAEGSPYPLLAAMEARHPSPFAAWQAAESDLARGLNDEMAARRGAALTDAERQQHTELATRLKALRPRIMRLVSKQNPSDTETKELSELLAERSELEDQLATLSVTLSRRQSASLTEIQSAIPDDAALVLWIDASTTGLQEHWGCVARRTGAPAWIPLTGTGTGGAWTNGDQTLPNQLRTALAHGDVGAEKIETLAKQLYAQRLEPLAARLDGVQRLYVIGTNQMAGIPVQLLTDRYTVSYLPSGTFLARLKDKTRPKNHSLLALGDPVFKRPGDSPNTSQALPPSGLLVTMVAPNGSAATAQLHPGDVLLSYAGMKLGSIENLGDAMKASAQTQQIPVTVWRDGKTLARTLPPGRLGISLARDPAPQALADRRKTQEMLLAVRGGDWQELPGTRIELAEVAKLFGQDATTLLDSSASEQTLDVLRSQDDLASFRYLHFATHGAANNVQTMESALILSQDAVPELPMPDAGKPLIDGRLSAREVLKFWRLDAELVTLSACDTALGRAGGGDGMLGFAQAFLAAGSRAVCLSLWKVDDSATALLMGRFYQNLLGQRPELDGPMPKGAALAEAKRWLRDLSAEEALKLTATATTGVVRGSRGKGEMLQLVVPATGATQSKSKRAKPFAHPRYWAAFILIGDPN